MIKYQVRKVETKEETCPDCKGEGKTEEKFYHNQYREVNCYPCHGTGKIKKEIESWVDINQVLMDILGFKMHLPDSELKKPKKWNPTNKNLEK